MTWLEVRDFYAGIPTAMKSVQNVIESSFAYAVSSGVMHVAEQAWSKIEKSVFLPLMTIAALLMIATTKPRLHSVQELATGLAAFVTIGSAILLLAAHLLAGVLYPEDRTGIYFIPLASFAVLGLARILADHLDGRTGRVLQLLSCFSLSPLSSLPSGT